jgi:hypothetical protein
MRMNRKEKQRFDAASGFQSLYRGHLGRKAANKWSQRRRQIDVQRSLLFVATLTIQRIYRGYAVRIHVAEKREELVAFILELRMKEAQEDEELFWKAHPGARELRRIRDGTENQAAKSSAACILG